MFPDQGGIRDCLESRPEKQLPIAQGRFRLHLLGDVVRLDRIALFAERRHGAFEVDDIGGLGRWVRGAGPRIRSVQRDAQAEHFAIGQPAAKLGGPMGAFEKALTDRPRELRRAGDLEPRDIGRRQLAVGREEEMRDLSAMDQVREVSFAGRLQFADAALRRDQLGDQLLARLSLCFEHGRLPSYRRMPIDDPANYMLKLSEITAALKPILRSP